MAKIISKLLFIILSLVCFVTVQAQQEGNVWVFGNHAGLNLTSGTPVAIADSLVTIEGSASVASPSGQLLFYTEGSTVWDRNNNVMPNGSNITGITFQNYSPTASTTQSSLIVPMPDSAGKYYLFSLTDGTLFGIQNLYYSIVDMSLNGGMGDIVPGRKGIVLDSTLSEKLTGTVGKRCDIWVVVNHKADGKFHAFEITAAGIDTTPVISPSGLNTGFGYHYGEIKFSPDGNHMSEVTQTPFGLKVYDFDGATGIFSNIQTISTGNFYGTCFSPDNSKLYASNASSDSLYQYDLAQPTLAGITNSQKTLAQSAGITDVKLAANGKVYFAGMAGISVIDSPDIGGMGCHVESNPISVLPNTYVIFGGLSNEVPVFTRDTTHSTIKVQACFKDSLVLHANDSGWDYQWDNGSVQTYSTVYSSGNYIVHYHTPPCVYHTDTFVVTINSSMPIVNSFGGCRYTGNGVAWVAPGPTDTATYTYTWSDTGGSTLQVHSGKGDTLSGLQQGTYTVSLAGTNGCDTTFNIIVYSPDSAGFYSNDTTCQHQPLPFTNTSLTGTNAVSYTWAFDDGSTDTATNPYHAFNAPGTYTVVLAANFGFCADSAGHTVTIVPFSVSLNNNICFGDSVRLSPAITAPTYFSGYSYAWSPATGLDSATIQSPMFYAQSGSYTYVFTVNAPYPFGCTLNDTVTINVLTKPTLTNLTPSQTIKYGSSLQLNADGATYYFWMPNNGTLDNPNINNPIATPTDPTTYIVIGMDSAGCRDTAEISIAIDYSMGVFIPTAFSPNGDGRNDVLRVLNIKYQKLLDFCVFNRWGQMVFHTTNPGQGWDGMYNGVTQPIGVYNYMVELAMPDGTEQQYKGDVTLMR